MTPRFAELFWRLVVRSSWRHPLLAALEILSIALGVAVFLAIQISNRGALAGFRAAADLTTGRADLEIRGDLPETLLPEAARMAGVRAATPLVEGLVTIPGAPGEYLRILGVDPFTGSEIFSFRLREAAGSAMNLDRWLGDAEAVAIQPSHTAVLQRAEKDGVLEVLAGGFLRRLRPAFALEPREPFAQADPRIAAMDIGWAQELLGRAGRLSAIQILLDDRSHAEAVAQALRELAPPDAIVGPPVLRSREMETMLGAFQLNLTAMSLVSVVVGMFLVYNSVAASVVRRRGEIAILRASGATRWEVRALFLGEALLAAALGSVIGIAAAPLLAALVAAPLSESISSLYEVVRINRFELTWGQMGAGLGLGLGAAVLAAWLPASEAAACDPARILHPGSAMESFTPLRLRWLAAGTLFLAAAAGLSFSALNGGPRFFGFAAAGSVIAGFSLFVPWVTAGISRSFRPAGILPRIAADHLKRSLHRNGITIAALAAAAAMAISVTVMIFSFRASVQRWIGKTLVADLYLAPAENEIAGPQAFLPSEAVSWTQAHPAVAEVATFRELPVQVQGQDVSLAVIEGPARGDPEFLPGSLPEAKEEFLKGRAVAVSESFATRFGAVSGTEIVLQTPSGARPFRISGIYRDFSRDRGVLLMQRVLFEKFWPDGRIHSLAVELKDPTRAESFAADFRAHFGKGVFAIYDNAALRGRVMEIFDRTFAVTSVLRGIAILVAVIGVFFSLSVLVAEREREIGVLRSLGASRVQVMGIFLGEAALLGLAASLCGLACGAVLAAVLTWVVNKAFFGWTIALTYPPAPLAAVPFWLVAVAVLAALWPAWRASRIPPARAVRFE